MHSSAIQDVTKYADISIGSIWDINQFVDEFFFLSHSRQIWNLCLQWLKFSAKLYNKIFLSRSFYNIV